ncbi:MAG: hypothetical protein GY856_42015 [bacterium]|nr:hypothetical protein [bacterium]
MPQAFGAKKFAASLPGQTRASVLVAAGGGISCHHHPPAEVPQALPLPPSITGFPARPRLPYVARSELTAYRPECRGSAVDAQPAVPPPAVAFQKSRTPPQDPKPRRFGHRADLADRREGDPSFAAADPPSRSCAELREGQGQGPYRLAGLSFGGLVAYDMACRLRADAQHVALLAL